MIWLSVSSALVARSRSCNKPCHLASSYRISTFSACIATSLPSQTAFCCSICRI